MLGAVVGLAGANAVMGYLGNREQEKASRVQRQIARLRAAQARRQIAQETQSSAAGAVAAGAVTGTLQSSRTQQAIGSAASQAGAQYQYEAQSIALGDQASKYLNNAARYQFYGSLFGSGATIAGSIK